MEYKLVAFLLGDSVILQIQTYTYKSPTMSRKNPFMIYLLRGENGFDNICA